jgi:hypothetical protein
MRKMSAETLAEFPQKYAKNRTIGHFLVGITQKNALFTTQPTPQKCSL